MTSRILYAVSAVIVGAAMLYALLTDPRPCLRDDIATTCGSGARYMPLLVGVTIALVLSYVAGALSRNRRSR